MVPELVATGVEKENQSQKKQSRCIILVRLTTSEILFGMYIIHCSLQFDLGDDLN